jgi:3-oxoacyl-[acyl-carrier-protein] synthase II
VIWGDVMPRRAVITGLGVISPLGIGTKETWRELIQGKSGIGPITKFDVSEYRTQFAGQVKSFNSADFMQSKLVKRMDRFIQFAIAATRMAVEDSKLKIENEFAERTGCYLGCGLGGLETIERFHQIILDQGPRKVSPFFIPSLIANMAPGQISIEFGAKGPNLSVNTACAAGAHAIGESFHMIQAGVADAMITGGVESVITPLALAGFNAMRALSERNDQPEKASRPFDKQRDGFVMGEGSGIIILEELEHARERGAKIYAELIGYGLTGDAFHMTAPPEGGEGAVRCMRAALSEARIQPSEVQYINAHGTSTELNDLYECQAIKTVFGEHCRSLPVSSTKSMIGHLLGAAGGVETIFTALTIAEGIIPPTINYEYPDPDIDLDVVPNKMRRSNVNVAMSNSFGFGGTNATLILRKFQE